MRAVGAAGPATARSSTGDARPVPQPVSRSVPAAGAVRRRRHGGDVRERPRCRRCVLRRRGGSHATRTHTRSCGAVPAPPGQRAPPAGGCAERRARRVGVLRSTSSRIAEERPGRVEDAPVEQVLDGQVDEPGEDPLALSIRPVRSTTALRRAPRSLSSSSLRAQVLHEAHRSSTSRQIATTTSCRPSWSGRAVRWRSRVTSAGTMRPSAWRSDTVRRCVPSSGTSRRIESHSPRVRRGTSRSRKSSSPSGAVPLAAGRPSCRLAAGFASITVASRASRTHTPSSSRSMSEPVRSADGDSTGSFLHGGVARRAHCHPGISVGRG